MDLAKAVSVTASYPWTAQTLSWEKTRIHKKTGYHVVVYDYGVKWQILRLLADRGCRITVVPAQTGPKKFWL